jgi:excisionase family DNA binding protein
VASEDNNCYSATEAAQILRQSPQRIRALVSEGKLPGERQGEEWRIPVWAVHERLPRGRQERYFYPQEAVVGEPFALAFEELRRLRELAEEQKRRIASMESKLETQPPSGATEAPFGSDRRPDKAVGIPQKTEDIQKKKNARLRAELAAKRSKGFY